MGADFFFANSCLVAFLSLKVSHFVADTVNEKFLLFLLESIENGLSGDTDDRVGDIFVRLILAINLHFLGRESLN